MASAPVQQGLDRVAPPPESVELPGTLMVGAEEKSAGSENLKEKIPSTNDEKIASSSGPRDATSIQPPRERTDQLESLAAGADHSTVYQPNIYAPQAQTIYYGAYKNPPGKWDEHPQFLNPEGMEMGSQGAPSLMFHTGYGYSPRMPYGPYSPVATPLPSARGDGQMYSTQQFPVTGPYIQQPGPNAMPFFNLPTQASQTDIIMPVGIEQQGFDGFGSGGLWSEWLKFPDGQRSSTPFSPAVSPQPMGGVGPFGHNASPFSSGMGSPQQREYGYGSPIGPNDRGYSHGRMHHQGADFGANLRMNGWGWIAFDKGRRRGKGNTSLCNCNSSFDFLTEQTRGPRATRPKNMAMGLNLSVDNKNITSTAGVVHELYNKLDFVTEYEDAKFFIIKSYSEDNVHKSVKYGVWASTPSGNRKLDAAYHEAKEKGTECPVFLFFSVNASAQFCGVAEMTGPVDFENSVDYWQQDKWSGHFPVKWHIVKDVPNNLFRHIILENNDKKPVTNSRDTQEVKLEQGLEMLSIFKNHEADMSILDDFDFYEERQKAMQERKARQQQQQQQQASLAEPVAGSERRNPAPLPGDLACQMSKTFAQAVVLDENTAEDQTVARNGNMDPTALKAEDLLKSTASAVQKS